MKEYTENVQELAKEVAINMLRTYIAGYICALNVHNIEMLRHELYLAIDVLVHDYIEVINRSLRKQINSQERFDLLNKLKAYGKDVYEVK